MCLLATSIKKRILPSYLPYVNHICTERGPHQHYKALVKFHWKVLCSFYFVCELVSPLISLLCSSMVSLGSHGDTTSLATDLPECWEDPTFLGKHLWRRFSLMPLIACVFFFFVSATQSAILLEACKVLMCKICKVNMAFKCYTLLFQRILLVLNFFFLTFVGKCCPRSLEGYHLLVDLCQ